MKNLLAFILILLCLSPLTAAAEDTVSEQVQIEDSQEEATLSLDPSEDPNMTFDDEASLSRRPADSNRFFQHILQFSERYPSAHSR